MDYSRSVLILRQVAEGYALSGKTISAIARVETFGGVPSFSISTINAKVVSGGEYLAYLLDAKGKMVAFPLGVKPLSTTKPLEDRYNFDGGFACGLVFIKDGLPQLVAYSRTEGLDLSMSNFKKMVASDLLKKRNFEEKQRALELERERELFRGCDAIKEYDDEAVATENYFELDHEIDQKLGRIREFNDGSLPNANGEVITLRQEKTEQIKKDDSYEQSSARDDLREKFTEQNPYYSVAKGELNKLFERFPEDTTLKKYFPHSRWARINYSATKYYVVGVVREQNREKYICYGVPAFYSENPPRELAGFCSFIPLSVFDMKGDGFWMMFQDAVTGACVKKPN